MVSPAPVIRTSGLTRDFGGGQAPAVDHVSLDVAEGTIMALLGPSGCGKTTFLRLIAGFERPDAGSVEVGGRLVVGKGAWVPPERRRVGMVFQDYALFPHLDVAANVAFGLPRRTPDRARRVAQALDLVDLRWLGRRHPHELSGGEQQRVALARALAPRPAVVLLDEPFSNLDAALRQQVRADVRRILGDAEATAIFVTHDQEEALSLADEVAVMADGRIRQQDRPEALYRRPADRTVAGFVGDPIFLPGQVRNGTVLTDLGPLPLSAGTCHREVEALVRPEDLRVEADRDGEAVVIGREFYGHDQVLFVRLASGRVIRARTGPVSGVEPGQACTVRLDQPVQTFPRS